ncbi:MAG: dihydrodipicolinate synthase family protein [Acidobacteria bacterium]|nr:dihydrodipicolinate synthase family protein [Acidobacteriota bacterium]
MSKTIEGIIPILATPFHDDGSIDMDGQKQVVDHILDQGAHGVGVFGNAGEGYTLLADERRTLLEAIVKRVDGRVPVVVGIGATGTDVAVSLCKEAEQQGADALMVLPPYYLRPDGDGVVFFYQAIGDAVGIPIMVQDAPLLTQVPMPPALLARLAREIPMVTCAKIEAPPTAPKISLVLKASDGLVALGGLNGQFMIEEIQRGARGCMPAADMTSFYVQIWDHLEGGAASSAWDCFTRILPLVRFELQPGLGVSAVKHNLVARGVIKSARVRHPTKALDAAGLLELAVLRERLWPSS